MFQRDERTSRLRCVSPESPSLVVSLEGVQSPLPLPLNIRLEVGDGQLP